MTNIETTHEAAPFHIVWLGGDGSTYQVAGADVGGALEQFAIVTTEYTVPKPVSGSGVYVTDNYNRPIAEWVA